MKNKANLPGFTADLKYSAVKFNYFDSLNAQDKKDGSILMQRLRLPSNMGGLSLLNVVEVDCYTRVTRSCKNSHPGKDMSDKIYRDCINRGLDGCDRNEPV